MYVLALTGSIATGKSTVLAMFRDQNIATISSDEMVHDLYQNEAVKPLAKLFPKALKNSTINRKILSSLLLKEPKFLKKLEAIVHPLVQQKQVEFIEKQKKHNKKLVVLEIPLLFESSNNYNFDGVLVTFCNDELQRERALKRDGMNKQKLNFILKKQMAQSEKIKQADFIIDSSKSLNQMRKAVKKIITQIMQK